MLRRTLYGTWTDLDELDENEKALLYIEDCARHTGIEVTETTIFNVQFMAKVMKALRESEVKADEQMSSDNKLAQ